MTEKVIDYISGQEVLATPEEVDAVQVMSRILVEEYGYPKECIQTHPQYRVKVRPSDKKRSYPVDIAVFNSSNKDESSIKIIIECKKKNRQDGVGQLEDYLRFSRASLGIWFNGMERVFRYKTEENGKISFSDIPNIPRYGERLEDLGKHKRKDLKKPNNLKITFRSIRNYLASNAVGTTRDEVLAQQIINVIFCKIYDEKFTKPDDIVKFRFGVGESTDEVSTRIRQLFAAVKSNYSDVLDAGDNINLDTESLAYIVGELQSYCLTDAGRDVIAEAFETFIGHALKGGQGQFFTPRNVVRLLVEIIDPSRNDLIIDPACGSGGFLVESLRYVWGKLDNTALEYKWSDELLHKEKTAFAIKNISGLDKDSFLAKVSKAYMALIGDGKGGIFCEDSLAPQSQWSDTTRNHIKLGKYDVLLTNPPFGRDLQVTGEEKLQQYSLAYKWNNTNDQLVISDTLKSSVRSEILFIERSLQFLKKGGVMGIVLPETFFHAPKSKYIMNFLKQHNIQWIIDLPHNTFRPHNNAKCIAIVLQKNMQQEAAINLAVAEQMGHDHTGKDMYRYDSKTERVDKTDLWDDIWEIIKELKSGKSKKYTFSVLMKKCNNHEVYVPRYYWEAADQEIKSIADQQGLQMVPMRELIDNEIVSYFDGHGSPSAEYKGKGEYPYVRVKDIVNWEIYKDPTAKVPEHIFNQMVPFEKNLNKGDILFVRRGSYRIGSVAIASPYDSECLLTREILVLRFAHIPREKDLYYGLNPYYLLYLLSHRLVQIQINNKVLIETTLPNIGNRWLDLKLPIYKDISARVNIGDQVKKAIESKWYALELLVGLKSNYGELTT